MRVDMKSTIDALHGKLNELYAVDGSWREVGEWPQDVPGSILHAGASEAEIAQAETRFGHPFPPSYQEFLGLCSAWEHFWGDFTLVGTVPPAVESAQDEITENIEYQTKKLKAKFGAPVSESAVTSWQSEEPRNLYLANHLVIATNLSGFHWVYDTRTRDAKGEMKLVYWNISYGAQDPTFTNFQDFLSWAVSQVDFRLEHIKSKKGSTAD